MPGYAGLDYSTTITVLPLQRAMGYRLEERVPGAGINQTNVETWPETWKPSCRWFEPLRTKIQIH
jgi:hypothetical protein